MMSRSLPMIYAITIISIVIMSFVSVPTTTAIDRPGYDEQIESGTIYWYTGWLFNSTKVDVDISLHITNVSISDVTIDIDSMPDNISTLITSYIVNVSILHRMDVMNLPDYSGIVYSTWKSAEDGYLTDDNGTRVYDKINGMLLLADLQIYNISLFIISTGNNKEMVTYLDDVLIIGGVIVAIVISIPIIYALVIYPRLHRKQEKKREVSIGAKRKKYISNKQTKIGTTK